MNEGVVVAITLPLMIAATIIGLFVFLYKSRARKYDALVKIVELGGNVDPEMMKMLSQGSGGYKQDFKYGLIWLAVGIPLSLGMLFDEGIGAAVFGMIPVLVGVAFLISGKYRLREST